MQAWPLQKNCVAFYGNPRVNNAQWQKDNLVTITPPWKLYFEGNLVTAIRIHKKCAASLKRILDAIWKRVGKSQAEIDRIGMSKYSGSYNLRNIGGSNVLSMHGYGCAVDFDSANNSLGDSTPAMDRRVVEEFEREGWEWGGHWKGRPDGMHFQAAWTRVNPPRLGVLTAQPATTKKQLSAVSQKAGLLTKVSNVAKGIGAAAGSIFTADNLGVFTGWLSPFSGLGKYVLVAGVVVLGYWLLSEVLLKMMAKDHDEGRYTPSGAVADAPAQESADAVVPEPQPVA